MAADEVFRSADKTITVENGTSVFRAGDPAEQMFGIIAGSVRITAGLDVLREVGAGEMFGEMALIDDSPRSANAIATSDTTLAVIDRQTFLRLVNETPAFALDVMRTLVDRLR